VHEKLGEVERVDTELLDLLEYDFPVMEERLHMRDDPPPRLTEYAEKIERSAALVIVTPEYNNGYPGVLKNAIDYLSPKLYRRKPIGIVTVSAGAGGGTCLAQLRLVTLGLGAVPIPAAMLVTRVQDQFSETGQPLDPQWGTRADRFIETLLWFTETLSNGRPG
jgi:NAD(P)H-dependent FMN reductase